MDFNITIGREIEVPLKQLMEILIEAIFLHPKSIEDSNLFIVEKDTNKFHMAMIPNCTCEGCAVIKEKIRAAIRNNGITEEMYEELKRELRGENHDLAS